MLSLPLVAFPVGEEDQCKRRSRKAWQQYNALEIAIKPGKPLVSCGPLKVFHS